MNPKDTHTFQTIEKLFKNCHKPLRAYACRLVHDPCTAEDIVQDVFLELWIKRDLLRLQHTEEIKSYLFKAVYNRSINALVRKLPDPLTRGQTLRTFFNPPLQNPEQSLLLKELDEAIAGFVENLPPQCKKTFLLSRSLGLKNAEIAAQLGVSIKAVEKQIAKALRGLKEHLSQRGFFG
ncbi:MAG: RNA polymerase sigma-70 factor [Tannerellaceae bacterium]|jgi:RNA polymerase sigma-70 factor (ECF subfamily)|nr:RNA polymerase sigma-70 factor [Tannerellaceae bacterium]